MSKVGDQYRINNNNFIFFLFLTTAQVLILVQNSGLTYDRVHIECLY